MSLFACPDCGNQVSSGAESCPKCGKAFHRTAKRKYAVGCTLAILFTLLVSYCVAVNAPG